MSCTKSKLTELNGKKVSLEGYDVVLDDTIFFPEGGGQVTTDMFPGLNFSTTIPLYSLVTRVP